MKRLVIALIIGLTTSTASAHPGHGDPVHRLIGIDWSVAAFLIGAGLATVFLARNQTVRVLGGVAACGGLVFAASLV